MHHFEIKEHMEVRGSDGAHIGTVDRVEGERIKLTRQDPDMRGDHTYLPMSLVESCENDIVQLSTSADSARSQLSQHKVPMRDGQM